MTYKNKVDNKQCLLVEFLNEGGSLACGYKNWMKEKDQENIEEIIKNKTLVKIKWPDNVDVDQASIMNKLLKTVKWSEYPVKIIFYGGKVNY